jgi:esterase/lipase
MKKLLSIFLTLSALAMIKGCATFHSPSTALHQSAEYYDFLQPSFERYVEESRQWLRENRNFISQDIGKELNMNAPFILKPAKNEASSTSKAALLVHGLGDSPYSFSDVAKSLQAQGFHVHALLLPGHGSKPADLMLPNYKDWQDIVDHYAALLKDKYDEVWLGGFSTGANLVTINAIEQGGVNGLLLFSPGFETHSPFIEKLAPIADVFFDWGWITEEDNLARYRSSPLNASIAYTDSAERVRDLFESKRIEVPTFIVMSEADSVINPYAIKGYFDNNFTHDANRMLWYGESLMQNDKLLVNSMVLPKLQISTGSHMSPLFSPENTYYGKSGEKRMCENSFDSSKRARCKAGEDVWYSAWGYAEGEKIFARLTWNPYYQEMEKQLRAFIQIH